MINPRKELDNIFPYETDFHKQDWRLKLDANENIYGAYSSVISAIKNIPSEEISLYPTYGKFIDKFSKKYDLNNENILLTNGCDEALSVIVSAYLDKEDEILSYKPTFSMPSLYARAIGAKTRFINYSENFVFNKDDFEQNIQEQTKIIYISTPNNPTGDIVRASVLELLIQKYPNILFVIDCTYVNFSYSVAYEDYLDLTKKYENIIVVKSYSKDFALAGLRFGVAVSKKEIIENLKKVISPYSVNAIALYCAQIVLNDDKKIEEIKELNEKARTLLYDELLKIGYTPYKSEANFILCDFNSHSDFYYEKLKKHGVIVRKYSKDSILSTCLRITVPKIGGVKYIMELLNKKDLLLFSVDGTIIDISNSTITAIAKTYEHFAKKEISKEKVIEAKNCSGINSNWDCVKYLLKTSDIEVELFDIIEVFQDLYYNTKNKTKEYLIDNDELLIPAKVFDELSNKYDFAVFTNRFKDEVKYSFEKLGIDKYFYYYLTSDDLPKNMLKPNPKGVNKILTHCPNKSIKFFGASVDDIISGNMAQIDTIGVINPMCEPNAMINNFRHLGTKHIVADVKNIKDTILELEK